jgi:hypothetical protein
METIMSSVNIILGQTVMLFLSLTLFITKTERASFLCRVISREISAYFLSLSPIALLIYLLYVVSYRL